MPQKMSWEEIRENYPDTFVLLDNCEEFREEQHKVIIRKAEVVFTSNDGKAIYDEYRRRGKLAQMTFAHTQWEKLEIEERPFFGIYPSYA